MHRRLWHLKREQLAGAIALFVLIVGCSGGGIKATRDVSEVAGSGIDSPTPSPSEKGGNPNSTSSLKTRRAASSDPRIDRGTSAASIHRIFTADEDRVGITPTSIALCVHLPRAYLPLAGVAAAEEFGVYWDMVNDQGGVLGRRVRMLYEDDENTVQGTHQAMERCRTHSPFAILSGSVSVEILDAARAWAERTHTLYYFNYSSENPRRSYSFSLFPSLDRAGQLAAQWIMHAHPGLRIGLVRRQGPSYDAGADSFRRTLAARGFEVNVSVGTSFNQGTYRDQIAALQDKADVVYVLDDPLGATALIKQSRQQDYKPRWVLQFGFNLTTDALGADAVSPHPIEALSVWPPYKPGAYEGPYSPYGDQVRRFEEAFQQYRNRPPSSDVPWIFWTYWHLTKQQFLKCGGECTRNDFITINEWDAEPFCPMEFKNGSNFAGTRVSIIRAWSPSPGIAAWAQVPETVCRDSF